jgi:sec-independent protein translocase protein TatA
LLDPAHRYRMAIGDPFQILLILGVLAVVLIWGPQKIPELARSLGKARKEFDDASRGLTQHLTSPSLTEPVSDPLIETARKLGIQTQGRTRQEISDEIVKLAKPN